MEKCWLQQGRCSGFQSLVKQQANGKVQVHRLRLIRCLAAPVVSSDVFAPLKQLTSSEPHPVHKLAEAFAPATVANLGPGYDFLGCAVQGLGDSVIVEIDEKVEPGCIRIKQITGDCGRLSLDWRSNCAGIAGKSTMELLGINSIGLSLTLRKGLPLGSGLGSSAASAAAAAAAVNAVFGDPLTKLELIEAGLRSEAIVSGYHADNIAPSLLGGFVLVRSYNPLHIIPLSFPSGEEQLQQLYFVLSTPVFEAPTKEMRKVVPAAIELRRHTANCSQAAALVAAILMGDVGLLGEALSSDCIVEPARSGLIPGMAGVKSEAIKQGAFGCSISGAGPTVVAITDDEIKGRLIGERMVFGFREHGKLQASFSVHRLDTNGAHVLHTVSC